MRRQKLEIGIAGSKPSTQSCLKVPDPQQKASLVSASLVPHLVEDAADENDEYSLVPYSPQGLT